MIHRKCASTVAKTKPCHSGAGRTIARKGKGPHDQNGLLHVEFTKLDCSLPGSHLRSVRSDNRMAGGPGFHCHESAAYLSAGASLIWGCPTLLARFWREGGTSSRIFTRNGIPIRSRRRRVACPFGLRLSITLTQGCPTLVAVFWRQ